MNSRRLSRSGSVLVLLLSLPILASASVIDEILTRLEQSEFIFDRAASDVPFVPLSWVGVSAYGDSTLTLPRGTLEFDELAFSQMAVLPVWVGKRDLVLLGECVTWQQLKFRSPLTATRNVTGVMPVVAWLHQAGARDQYGAFVAPSFINGGDIADYALRDSSLYAGVLGIRWSSDRLAWAYGGIAIMEQGPDFVLPYVGLLWHPRPSWSVALIAPWPSVSYAPTRNTLFQFGLSPAGAKLGAANHPEQLRVGYDSWNALFSAHRRLKGMLWVSAGVGWSGFGSAFLSTRGHLALKHDLDRGPVVTLRFALRPTSPTRQPMR
jgi:hypothetical protein